MPTVNVNNFPAVTARREVRMSLLEWEDNHHPGSESEWEYGYYTWCGGSRVPDLDDHTDYDSLKQGACLCDVCNGYSSLWGGVVFTKNSAERVVFEWLETAGCLDDDACRKYFGLFRLDSGRGWGVVWAERKSDEWGWEHGPWYVDSAVLPRLDDLLAALEDLGVPPGDKEELDTRLLLEAAYAILNGL
jgi:hypothetical protein